MRPVEVTHESVGNWSDIEQAALAVAIKNAAAACAERSASDYTGEALIDLSRLCTLGLIWDPVIDATGRYLHAEDTAKPRAAQAYAQRINAELELKDESAALKDGDAMLDAVPYDAVVADSTRELLNYMELLFTADAVKFAAKRQPLLLAGLHAVAAVDAAANSPAPDAAALTAPELYRQGMVLAELEQLDGQPEAAVETMTTLDAALPASLAGDELAAVETMRGQYAQLGKPLGTIVPLALPGAALDRPGAPAGLRVTLPMPRTITVLLLFPDWCAQGIRLAKQIPEGRFNVQGHDAVMVGLLVETVPAEKLPESADGKASGFNPAYAAEYVKGTQTVTVPAAMLERFHATEVPLLIVVDSHGMVRLIEAADETVLQPGKAVDSAVALIGKRWGDAKAVRGR
jgi:hypothetical protein